MFESSNTHHFWDTPHHFLKTHFSLESGFLSFLELQESPLASFQGCWTQWESFEISSIHHFWDTPQHFLKTHFCWESGFLSFLQLQKSLLVSRVIKNRCLEYCYTKLGRQTFFGQWPSSTRTEMTCIPLHKTWQMNLPWSMNPLVPEQRWLVYHYTKLGRQTFFGQWPSSTRTEMTCIPLHKTWQMNLPWPMDPPVPEQRWLTYNYTKLGRWTYFGQWTTPVPEQRWLAYHYTKLGRWTYFGWTQWQRFQSSSIHHFWDTPQHFLKTHFCLESSFLSFQELQKSLLVTFQGCWTQWQRFESTSIHCFWDTPQHFLKTCFSLESGLLSFLQLQKSLLVNRVIKNRCLEYCYTKLGR